jgi:hypothetical protein
MKPIAGCKGREHFMQSISLTRTTDVGEVTLPARGNVIVRTLFSYN